jgi:quercetin dioxygenase-like cupin family protein
MVPNDIRVTVHISKALAVAAAAATLLAATAGLACDHQVQRRVASVTAPARPVKLLTARFEARALHKIEVGDFHFTAAQVAPVHTHAAPALGYVSKGSIVYQVEGQPVQLLKAGDAFYEPAGPRILHFDNGSTTEEAVFTDFNFERAGEPFIVFPSPPVDLKLDRRTFPTVDVQGGPDVRAIDVFAETIGPGASIQRPTRPLPVMGYVADGAVEIRDGESSRSVDAGHSFDLPAGSDKVTLTNRSPSTQVKIVTFEPSP